MPIEILKHFSLILRTSVLYIHSNIVVFAAVVLAEQFSILLFYAINIVQLGVV